MLNVLSRLIVYQIISFLSVRNNCFHFTSVWFFSSFESHLVFRLPFSLRTHSFSISNQTSKTFRVCVFYPPFCIVHYVTEIRVSCPIGSEPSRKWTFDYNTALTLNRHCLWRLTAVSFQAASATPRSGEAIISDTTMGGQMRQAFQTLQWEITYVS